MLLSQASQGLPVDTALLMTPFSGTPPSGEAQPSGALGAWLKANLRQRWSEDFGAHPVAFRRVSGTPLDSPRLAACSAEAARLIGLPSDPNTLDPAALAEVFAQATVPDPVATAYAGHQFGVWAGQLGDVRALLLGDCPSRATAADWGFTHRAEPLALGDRVEIQLKGAGETPYSRRADGRAVLRSSIREFLASEALAALGIPTTRALCLFRAEDPVFRESVESAAVVTRLAPSFVRFGHVEFFAHFQHEPALLHFLELVVRRHFPEVLKRVAEANRGSQSGGLFSHPGPLRDAALLGLLGSVAARTGDLIARWQAVGFCHGVMNTDNMSLLGLTIDYGPYGFLDRYDEDHVCNHSDHTGRYSYANQPAIGAWNCRALAYALRRVMTDEGASQLGTGLLSYREAFERRWRERFLAKFGLAPPALAAAIARAGPGDEQSEPEHARDAAKSTDLLECLEESMRMLQLCKPDFTVFFRRLAQVDAFQGNPPWLLRDLVLDTASFDCWWARYQPVAAQRCQELGWDARQREGMMNAVNPCYVLRNHLAETAIAKARGDHGPAEEHEILKLLGLLRRPYDEQEGFEAYADEAPAWAQDLVVSCSS